MRLNKKQKDTLLSIYEDTGSYANLPCYLEPSVKDHPATLDALQRRGLIVFSEDSDVASPLTDNDMFLMAFSLTGRGWDTAERLAK